MPLREYYISVHECVARIARAQFVLPALCIPTCVPVRARVSVLQRSLKFEAALHPYLLQNLIKNHYVRCCHFKRCLIILISADHEALRHGN